MAGGCLPYLQKVVQECPDFFTKVDLFTGTSDGSFSALFLASHTDEELANGPKMVEGLIELHKEMYNKAQVPNPWYELFTWRKNPDRKALYKIIKKFPSEAFEQVKRYISFLSGWGTLLDNRKLELFLRDVYSTRSGVNSLQPLTLGELPQKVLILTFDLGRESYTQTRTFGQKQIQRTLETGWGPRMYHNLQYEELPPEIKNLNIRDLAIRSGALPIFFPIQNGCVDGAVYANNPSMAAFSLVKEHLSGHHSILFEEPTPESKNSIITHTTNQDILQFSIGGGDRYFLDPKKVPNDAKQLQDSIDAKTDSKQWWGYWKWLLDPRDPLRAIKLFFNASDNGITYQCENIMGKENYYRFSILPQNSSVHNMLTFALGTTHQLLDQAIDEAERWHLKSSPWETSILLLMQACGILNPVEPSADNMELPIGTKATHSALHTSPTNDLPEFIQRVLYKPFKTTMVEFPRATFKKELHIAYPEYSNDTLEERLDLLAAYIYIGSEFAEYIEETLARLIALHNHINPHTFLALLIDRVYNDLQPKYLNAQTFSKNVGLFALELWRQLDNAYYQGEHESSFKFTLFWLKNVWLLPDTRSANSVTIRPLWKVFTQRESYGVTTTSTPILLDIFRQSQEIYEKFKREQVYPIPKELPQRTKIPIFTNTEKNSSEV